MKLQLEIFALQLLLEIAPPFNLSAVLLVKFEFSTFKVPELITIAPPLPVSAVLSLNFEFLITTFGVLI